MTLAARRAEDPVSNGSSSRSVAHGHATGVPSARLTGIVVSGLSIESRGSAISAITCAPAPLRADTPIGRIQKAVLRAADKAARSLAARSRDSIDNPDDVSRIASLFPDGLGIVTIGGNCRSPRCCVTRARHNAESTRRVISLAARHTIPGSDSRSAVVFCLCTSQTRKLATTKCSANNQQRHNGGNDHD